MFFPFDTDLCVFISWPEAKSHIPFIFSQFICFGSSSGIQHRGPHLDVSYSVAFKVAPIYCLKTGAQVTVLKGSGKQWESLSVRTLIH